MAKKNSTAPKKAMIFNSVLMINAENVVSFVNSLPKCRMSEQSFNSFMEKNFFFGGKYHGLDFNAGSHYSTVVRQLGLYQILGNEYIPRFYSNINEEVAELFLKYWLKLYIAPNPTSQPSFRKSVATPKFILKELIRHIEKDKLTTNIYDIVDKIYNQEFSRNDKGNLPTIIRKYSDCINVDENNNVSLRPNFKEVMNEINELINNPNRYFEHFGEIKKASPINVDSKPLQQIFYGAPGTGKSHEIKRLTKEKSVIRTTFHPDSDYSTFVGSYKPVTENIDVQVVPVVINNGISLDQNEGTYKEKRISYRFVIQAFLKAYLGAWKKYADKKGDEAAPQFLIIEEINRGNCAQIFGDLFQLLDRGGNGFSEYPIEADTDLKQEIEKAFTEDTDYQLENDIDVEGVIDDYTSNYNSTLSEDIQHGRVLLLPKNLYIWATMNTSDQSLFPIDSAFKRRWDWEYMPIGYKNTNWTIEIGTKKYNWVDFQKIINEKIYSVNNSEDKQLGDYFVNADRTDYKISADTLLNKILFYLWNDVCKDDPDQIFQWKDDKDNNKAKSIKFSDFFCDEKERKLQGFMAFLEVPAIGESDDSDNSENINSPEETSAESDNDINS